jgi:Spy/CpxP family protein refolding chaperone
MLLLAPVYPAAAQRTDSVPQRRGGDSLRHQIEERFASRVQEQLGLSDEQAAKLRATSQQYGGKRRELRARQRSLHRALAAQLQPGVAANQDSVARLADAMVESKLAAAQITRDEQKALARYLTPVQRARLLVMRDRFRHRVKEAREHHGRHGPRREGRMGGEWGDGEMPRRDSAE